MLVKAYRRDLTQLKREIVLIFFIKHLVQTKMGLSRKKNSCLSVLLRKYRAVDCAIDHKSFQISAT